MLKRLLDCLENAFERRGFVIGIIRDTPKEDGFKAFDINNAGKEIFIFIRAVSGTKFVQLSIGDYHNKLTEQQLAAVSEKCLDLPTYSANSSASVLLNYDSADELDIVDTVNKVVRGYWAAVETTV